MGDIEGHLERRPFILNGHTMAMLTIFRATNSLLDLWAIDYSDIARESRTAARQLMAQIAEEASINFLWELREAIKDEIVRHNKLFGTAFPADRPDGDPCTAPPSPPARHTDEPSPPES